MPSRKTKAKPWWFPPTITHFDVIPNDKVLREYNYAIIQKISYEFAAKQYPNRPLRANEWTEPVVVDGATYIPTLSIDEINRRVVIKNIRPPKMLRKGRRKKR